VKHVDDELRFSAAAANPAGGSSPDLCDAEFDAYLGLLTRFLRLSRKQRDEIRRELRAHIDDALEYEMAAGASREQALLKILDDFGDAAELAARFSAAQRKRRWLMHGTLAAASIGFLAFSFNFLPVWHAQSADRSGATKREVAQKKGIDTYDNRTSAIRAAIAEPVDEIAFEEAPVEQVFEWLRAYAHINMYVQWSRLEEIGVDHDQTVSVELTDVPIERILRLVCDELDEDVDFKVVDGVLIVSTSESFNRRLVTRVYDVRDLLTRNRTKADSDSAPDADDDLDESHEAERLHDLLIQMVSADTWEELGGQGQMQMYHGALVVRQYEAVQEETAELLDALRTQRAPR